ncbi:MAG: hypothetical protein HKO13_00400 [Sphingomonas sp.]|nr:hypothetical protein [Sphingomonas sp.]
MDKEARRLVLAGFFYGSKLFAASSSDYRLIGFHLAVGSIGRAAIVKGTEQSRPFGASRS